MIGSLEIEFPFKQVLLPETTTFSSVEKVISSTLHTLDTLDERSKHSHDKSSNIVVVAISFSEKNVRQILIWV